MNLMDLVENSLGNEGISAIAERVGVSEGQAQQAVGAALPLLLGQLTRNAQQPEQAEALERAVERDHDGSALSNIASVLGGASGGAGQAILRHVLGGRQSGAAEAVGRAAGVDSGKAGQILAMLAPIVMGALGRARQQEGTGGGGNLLATILQGQQSEVQERARQRGLAGALGGFLDADGDGDFKDDIAQQGLKALGGLLGKKRRS